MWFSREIAPTSCASGEARFSRLLLRAAKHHILNRCVHDRHDRLTDEATKLTREREWLRTLNPADPQVPLIQNNFADIIAEKNRERWRSEVDSCQQTQNTRRLWRLVAMTTGKKPRNLSNQSIIFNSRRNTTDQEITSFFYKQFTTTIRHTSDPAARHVGRQILRDHLLDNTFSHFTVVLVKSLCRGGIRRPHYAPPETSGTQGL